MAAATPGWSARQVGSAGPTAGSREQRRHRAAGLDRAPTTVTMAVAVPATTVDGVQHAGSFADQRRRRRLGLLGHRQRLPVSDDSSTSTSAASMNRASAGTTSPGRTSMTSPGRSARAGTVCAPPSGIRTRAGASCTANRRCSNRSARMRCVAAKAALPVNTEPTSAASTGEPAPRSPPIRQPGPASTDRTTHHAWARAKSATARLTAAPAALAVPDAAVAKP